MAESITWGAAQIIARPGDLEANVAEHLRLIEAAAREQARVLVFPELSLTGYELDLAVELAFSENDARLTPLREAAVRHGQTIVVGAPIRLAGKLHIGAFIFEPDGSLDIYTKQRLGTFPADVNPGGRVPPPEPTVFAPGDRNPLLTIDGHTAALAICADIGRPTHAEAAAARGARNYLVGMFVIPADHPGDSAKLRSYAACHAMNVVFANYGGPTGGLPSAGRSAIWSNRGELLVQLPATGSGIALARETPEGWETRAVLP